MRHPVRPIDYGHLEKLLSEADTLLKAKKYSSRDAARVIKSMLSVFNLPHPDVTVLKYFGAPEIIKYCLRQLIWHQDHNFERSALKDLSAEYKYALGSPKGGSPWSGSAYWLRRLGANGLYPNEPIGVVGCRYEIIRGMPFIITKNSLTAEEKSKGFSETAVMTRQEVRVLYSLMAPSHNFFRPTFPDEEFPMSLETSWVAHVPEKQLPLFLGELYFLTARPPIAPADYEFAEITKEAQGEITALINKFKITDLMLLRASSYLIKANLLATSFPLIEEAIGSVFCALEGSILLTQKKHGLAYKKILWKEFRNIMKGLVTTGHDEELVDFIEEVFGPGNKRATVFHPEATSAYGWVAQVVYEDYRDYWDISSQLLIYVITGKMDPHYRSWP